MFNEKLVGLSRPGAGAFLVTTQTPQMNWYIEKYLFPPKLKKMNLL